MPGPCSLPAGSRAEWLNHNEVICNMHNDCTPGSPKTSKNGEVIVHDFVTRRVWLAKRNRLRTGKTR